ncbi:MAG: hypothetical protein LBE65_00110 [Synergistaceae bacterium]|nr:hypothetical protein [Synergistaceae bacterium]
MKRKNWLSWLVLLVMGMFVLMSGGCVGGGGNDTPIYEPIPDPDIPDPEGEWSYDTDITWYNDAQTEFLIDTPSKLAGFARLVNSGNDFEGKIVRLTKPVNLGAKYWTPIGLSHDGASFSGTFDGQGYAISNVIVKKQNSGSNFGFFGVNNQGTLKNINLVDVSISVLNDADGMAQLWVGGLAGYNYVGTITNCTVTAGSVSAATKEWNVLVGGLVGFHRNGTIKDCKSINVNVSASYIGEITEDSLWAVCIGGFVGEIETGTVTNNTVIGGEITSSAGGIAPNIRHAHIRGGFTGRVEGSTVYGNTAVITPKIGWDVRESPAKSTDNI